VFEVWAARAAPALARAAVLGMAVLGMAASGMAASGMAVFDSSEVVIDRVLSPAWRARPAALMVVEMARYNRAGLNACAILAGSIDPGAWVLGAALLPLQERFSPDPDLIAAPRRAPSVRTTRALIGARALLLAHAMV
jgi:hypothetical protein